MAVREQAMIACSPTEYVKRPAGLKGSFWHKMARALKAG